MSPELRSALQAWIDWVDRGADDFHPPFNRYQGLCGPVGNLGADMWELARIFIGDGLSPAYPFGEDDYDERCITETQHECPKRLAWVRQKLKTARSN